MKKLHVDLETFSEVNLPKTGLHFYARHPSTKVLLLAYAFGNERPKIIDLKHGEKIPDFLIESIESENVIKFAHNASFEMEILKNVLNFKIQARQWRCTMIQAFYLSLPGGLDKLSELMNLNSYGKDREGKKLISLFSVPNEKTQTHEDWQKFKNYCLQDVMAEQRIHFHMDKYSLPAHEHEFYFLDQKINSLGLPIDLDLAKKMKNILSLYKEDLELETKKITNLENPNSRNQLLEWLKSQGLEIPDLKKETVSQFLARECLDKKFKKILSFRQEASRSSLAKLDVLMESVAEDGRLRGAFQFYGAGRTGRFAGRRFQPQNLPRPLLDRSEIEIARKAVKTLSPEDFPKKFPEVTKVLSSLLRSVISAPKDFLLVVSDFSSIESVTLAWICEDQEFIQSFIEGKDPYKNFASKIFGKDYDSITKTERNLAKPAVLGCGYGLGAFGLQRYAEMFGLILSDYEAKRQVDLFRKTYFKIPLFWNQISNGIFHSLSNPFNQFSVGKFLVLYDEKFLSIELPSKRKLFYYKPKIETDDYGRPQLTYAGRQLNLRVHTHPGKIVENLTQAVARDVLVEALKKVDEAGLSIVGHVHDEIICIEKKHEALEKLELLNSIMKQAPEWGLDLPMKSEGYVHAFYQK